MVSKLRHSLSDQSIRASTILGSWLRSGIPGIIDEAELLENLHSKRKRPNNGKGVGKGKGNRKGKGKEMAVESSSESESELSGLESGLDKVEIVE